MCMLGESAKLSYTFRGPFPTTAAAATARTHCIARVVHSVETNRQINFKMSSEKLRQCFQRHVTWPRALTTAMALVCLTLVIVIIYFDNHKKKTTEEEKEHDSKYHMDLVREVNSDHHLSWKAKYNPSAFTAMYSLPATASFWEEGMEANATRGILLLLAESQAAEYREYNESVGKWKKRLMRYQLTLPESFDARTRWSHCGMLQSIPDQGACGSCWAMAMTSAVQDRICIHTNGVHQPQISAEDLVSCCRTCGGCTGLKSHKEPYEHWITHGLVTGGDYGSFDGCRPYQKSSECGHPCHIRHYRKEATGECKQTCQRYHSRSYEDDKYYGRNYYWLLASSYELYGVALGRRDGMELQNMLTSPTAERRHWELMKKELYIFGPFSLCFPASEQYQHYASGVFENKPNYKRVYGHCNKVLGWGVENNTEYLLLMNTWGRSFGQQGFIKYNMANLLQKNVEAMAAMPDLDRLPKFVPITS